MIDSKSVKEALIFGDTREVVRGNNGKVFLTTYNGLKIYEVEVFREGSMKEFLKEVMPAYLLEVGPAKVQATVEGHTLFRYVEVMSSADSNEAQPVSTQQLHAV